ncbi:MAG: GNAT family acetyltransferase [Clostridia bacterium]|nr:GNAT family acetyltransferase [Clostridia bacterium]
MKRLIMCEGPNELTLINILLENDALVFSEDDLLGLTAYHARQIKTNAQVRLALNLYDGNDVTVMRVGDKQTDRLLIPADFKDKIYEVEKYCTLPELEMLLLISEDLVKEYEKVKSTVRPKVFAKEHIRCNRRRYDNSSRFYRDYYGNECRKLINAIREYKRIRGSHEKDELYLADILK